MSETRARVQVETLAVGPFQANCVLLGCPATGEAIVVDPGDEGGRVVQRLQRLGWSAKRILLTHAHIDHVGGVQAVRLSSGAPVALHPDDRPLFDRVGPQGMAFGLSTEQPDPPDEELADGGEITFGAGHRLVVLHTPGHSPGGVCLHLPDANVLVAGDTLFAGSIGRTDLWGGDHATLIRSIRERLLELPPATRVICGHGPETTIGDEAQRNPFVRFGFAF